MSSSRATAGAQAQILLGELTDSVDSLPHDLTKAFGDLRELDAVLSSSVAALISKIVQLTSAIENNTVPKEDRLWLLADIAEEASRLKLGGEDKIRVACHAADGLKGHRTHMKTLLDKIPSLNCESCLPTIIFVVPQFLTDDVLSPPI